MSEERKTSISNRCAPAAKPASQQAQQHEQPDIWSLTQMGSGMAGKESRSLVVWPERLTDSNGNFQGEIIHPIIVDLQSDPSIAGALREIEMRAAVTTDRKPGLVFRKLPYGSGSLNTWTSSAETVMNDLVESCGRARSDHNNGVYYFERLNTLSDLANIMPDVDIMIDTLLADFVIDRRDHPTLQRLLNQGPQNSSSAYESASSVPEDEVDDEIY